jgi:hypothetical protein
MGLAFVRGDQPRETNFRFAFPFPIPEILLTTFRRSEAVIKAYLALLR